MSGPNVPLAKGFEMAGWHILAIDLLFGRERELSNLDNQATIRKQLKRADFIWAALDRSNKSRIREILRRHPDPYVLGSSLGYQRNNKGGVAWGYPDQASDSEWEGAEVSK